MKRHASLVELSRDHYDGLLLANRLMQGKKALLRLWSHDPAWQAEYVVKFFEDHLERHFRDEETHLFPLAQRHLGKDDPAVPRLIGEHGEMRTMAESFRRPEPARLEADLAAFGALLERHIRTEEREFFPLCEERIPGEELLHLGKLLSHT